MDILHLVDRLEELFNKSRPVWFTHSVIVDEDRMLDLIDQMRVAIPEEIRKAQQIISQRDRILAQAKEEANRTISLAREKAETLLTDNELIQSAQLRATEIISEAKRDVVASQQDADKYVLETLSNLEIHMDRIISQVRNGIIALKSDSFSISPQAGERDPETD
ncbi:MAG: hypothetical protein ACOX7C_01200 [Brevefilum sp.]|jgi:cell division septum initiation protein DivIVA